jgi:hypothetical protein
MPLEQFLLIEIFFTRPLQITGRHQYTDNLSEGTRYCDAGCRVLTLCPLLFFRKLLSTA